MKPTQDQVPISTIANRSLNSDTVGLDDGQDQDDEAPEGQGVRDTWHRPHQQLALPDHLGDLGLRARCRVLAKCRDALGRRLPGPAEPEQPPEAAARDRARDDRQGESDDDAQCQGNLQVWQWVTA